MILDFMLDLLKTYLPIAMGFIYLYGYQKNKIQNLVKFFVLRTLLSGLEFLLIKVFMFAFWIIHYSMIPVYLYLSIYSYSYASTNYDIAVAPLLNFFIEYHSDLVAKVEQEKNRIKILEQHGKIRHGEVNQLEFLSKFQRMIYKTFLIDNMYLLK